LDRIDLQVQVPAVPFRELSGPAEGDGSRDLRARVLAARERQARRFAKSVRIFANAHMSPRLIKEHCPLTDETRRLLETAMDLLGLSARAYARILKIARTIADLEGEDRLVPAHVAEAIQYRTMDRKLGV
jgi:magnesium chelatase family protein